ncbi:hypothetical protein CA600_12390 [Paenibacillus sp. VTT E-133280]|uniref:hypothetical protein n=1 Tax=Paenibacillus sp. VTT E-133280 TaxID=1986222 RepID=UPI000BA10272|nr:hypothetical protein [Paenibacillus sp. VTT E-133280]OZQ66052.1 hypothetical protein CA600_12390 [Paenibacillus sp. VTT E-133280]
MVIIKKLELALDLTRPAEELVEAIITVLEFYPGRQIEILQQVDHRVGEMLAASQRSQKESEEKDETRE